MNTLLSTTQESSDGISGSVKQACPVCGASDWEVFFEMLSLPIFCNVLWSEQQVARDCDRGDIRLSFCRHCGFIGNRDFDPSLLTYAESYENSLDFSPRFQAYARNLATKLISDYDLHRKKIIEIGCGKGDFLVSLCEMGNNYGVGFDPTYVPLPEHKKLSDRVQFIQDFYSEKYSEYQSDFIVCRHTLEHVQYPPALLNSLRHVIGDRVNTSVFFEVPNGLDTFRHMAIWDIIYEHCCYFTPVSLIYAFAQSGFQIDRLSQEFQGQFLCLEAVPRNQKDNPLADLTREVAQLADDIDAFKINFQNKIQAWQEKLNQTIDEGRRAVVWGAGSKGVTFLNLLKTRDHIEYVVDINPRKQGMYVAGTGQKIIAPEELVAHCPDDVFIMNSIYKDEIQQNLANLGLQPELMCV